MKKLFCLFLVLFSLNTYALSEQDCMNDALFMSQVGFNFRDNNISLKTALEVVSKQNKELGPEFIRTKLIPLTKSVYSQKNKKTEVIAETYYESCIKGIKNGDRLPRQREDRWQDRTDLQRGRDSPTET